MIDNPNVAHAVEALDVDLNDIHGLGGRWRRLDDWERQEIRERWGETIVQAEYGHRTGQQLIDVLTEYPTFQAAFEQMDEENAERIEAKWIGICFGAVPRFVRNQSQWNDKYAERYDSGAE